MAEKRALVVYYSRTGNTRQVAEAIAEGMQCDIEQVSDTKKRSGLLGFLAGIRDSLCKKTARIAPARLDPGQYELLIVGTPVWAGTMTPAIRAYITEHKEHVPALAFFLTTNTSGIEGTFASLAELAGKEPLGRLGLTAKDLKKGDWRGQVSAFVEQIGK